MISIRPIAFADLTRVLEMIQGLSAYHKEVAEITFDDLQRDAMGTHPWVQVLVAEQAGELIGYTALIPKVRFHDGQRGMEVHHLYVDPKLRGKGIGQRLLDASASEAKSQHCTTLFIGTAPDNTEAQRIYETYGFERVEGSYPKFKLALT